MAKRQAWTLQAMISKDGTVGATSGTTVTFEVDEPWRWIIENECIAVILAKAQPERRD